MFGPALDVLHHPPAAIADIAGGAGAATLQAQPTRFGPNIAVKGAVFAEQDLLVSGAIDGNLDAPNHVVTIAPDGRVTGQLFAKIVTVHGHVTGEVTAVDRIEILPGATVEGNLTAPRVSLQEGAFYQGRVEMKRADAAVRVAQYRLEKKSAANGRR